MAVKSHFAEKVVPTLHQILESNDKGVAMIYSTDEEEEEVHMGIIKQIVEESPANPHEILVVLSGVVLDYISDHLNLLALPS